MPENKRSQTSSVDVRQPTSGNPLEMSLASGKSYCIRLLPPQRWIRVDLVDEFGQPAAGEVYRVETPDGTIVKEGTLDDNGCAQVEGLSSEEYIISFPQVDLDAWSYLGSSEQQG